MVRLKNVHNYKGGNDKDFVIMDKDLLRGLSEKEVEIEHLKSTIIAHNYKVEVNNI
jgi:glycerol-3-phosphate responsive antiterminator